MMKHLKKLTSAVWFLILCQLGFAQVAEIGIASFYHTKFEGKPTASGQAYDGSKMTAAHPTLPFDTEIRVTNLENERSVILTVNDRGPFVKGRIVDVSKAAAVELGFYLQGTAEVKLEVLVDE